MREMQERIKKFNDEREWSNPKSAKDLMLNMTEEIGEMWNIIKWVDVDKQQELVKKHNDEVENFIGDMLYLTFKLAYLFNVDSQKGIEDVMNEYEKRFPVEQTKGNHANTRADGIDLK